MMEKYFFGGVTPNGFSTQLTPIINGKEFYTYILKGGPGTGKSQMMKKIAERFAKSENVTCFYCSSDPDSLDAVMLHSSKVIVVDGTPPHVSEPRFPGVCQEIVDLGKFWDMAFLKKNRVKIIEAIELNSSIMAGAANHNKALGLICDDTYLCAERFVDRQRIEEAARNLFETLLTKHDRKIPIGRKTIRQLSVMTKLGYTTLPDAARSRADVFMAEDELFAASSMFIDFVAELAMGCGYDVKLSTCLLSGRAFSEHLLIDELGTALMTSNPLTRLAYENAEGIDCSVYYDKKRMQPYEKHFAANLSMIDTIAGQSREMLDDAKRVHDEIEHYYTCAMDFEALDRVCDEICKETELRGHR